MLPSWMAAISSTTSLSTSATCERSFDRVGWSSSTTASGPRSPPPCATSNSTPDGTRSHSKPRRASGLTGSPTLASSLPSKASRRSETTYGLEARLGERAGMSHERLRGLSLVECERRRQAAVGIDLREQVVGLLLDGLDRVRARNPAQRRLLLVDDGHKSLRELRGVAALLAAHCLPGGPRLGGALGVVGDRQLGVGR